MYPRGRRRGRRPRDHYYLSVTVTKAKRGEQPSRTNSTEYIANDRRVGVIVALPCIRGRYFETGLQEDQSI